MNHIVRVEHEPAPSEPKITRFGKQNADKRLYIADRERVESRDMSAVDDRLELDIAQQADLEKLDQIAVGLRPEERALGFMEDTVCCSASLEPNEARSTSQLNAAPISAAVYPSSASPFTSTSSIGVSWRIWLTR
jgi:hypothetical protein